MGRLPDFPAIAAVSERAAGRAIQSPPISGIAAWRSRAGRPPRWSSRAHSGAQVYRPTRGFARRPRGEHARGQINCVTRCAATSVTPVRRQALHARTADRDADGAPRGWHLDEKHVRVDGRPLRRRYSTSTFLLSPTRGRCWRAAAGPYFYLPSSRAIRGACGTTSSTRPRTPSHSPRPRSGDSADRDDPRRVRDGRDPLRAAGTLGRLNCGRWDYISARSRSSASGPTSCWPDRARVTMDCHFSVVLWISWFARATTAACTAMGAWRADPITRRAANARRRLAKVRQDKFREVYAGHDGTW